MRVCVGSTLLFNDYPSILHAPSSYFHQAFNKLFMSRLRILLDTSRLRTRCDSSLNTRSGPLYTPPSIAIAVRIQSSFLRLDPGLTSAPVLSFRYRKSLFLQNTLRNQYKNCQSGYITRRCISVHSKNSRVICIHTVVHTGLWIYSPVYTARRPDKLFRLALRPLRIGEGCFRLDFDCRRRGAEDLGDERLRSVRRQ